MNFNINRYLVLLGSILFILILLMILLSYFDVKDGMIVQDKEVQSIQAPKKYISIVSKKIITKKKLLPLEKTLVKETNKQKEPSKLGIRRKKIKKLRDTLYDKNYCQNSIDKAYTYFNKIRTDSGLIALKRNKILEQAATNHSEYLYENFEYIPHDITMHNEDESFLFFTGEKSQKRAIYEGYSTNRVGEGIAFARTSRESIDGLMTAIYHRFSILDFKIDEVGLSNYKFANNCMFSFVHNPSNSILNNLCKQDLNATSNDYKLCKDEKKMSARLYWKSMNEILEKNPKYVLYPPSNGKNIIRMFYGEIPDPMPDRDYTANPVSIQFNHYFYKRKEIEMISFRMQDIYSAQLLEGKIVKEGDDVNDLFNSYQFAFFPYEIYKPYTAYIVEFKYKINEVEQEPIVWRFTTGNKKDYRNR